MPIPPRRHRLLLATLLCASLFTQPSGAKDATPFKGAAAKADPAEALAAKMAQLDGLTPESITPAAKLTAKVTLDNEKTAEVEITRLDLDGFAYTAKDGTAGRQSWFVTASGSAANDILKKAANPKDSGHQVLAARILVNLKMGGPLARFYLKQASLGDKTLATPGTEHALLNLAIGDYNKSKPEWAWPRLSATEQAERIEELGRSIRADAVKAGLKLPLCDQSEHFIFYTDADLATARRWAKKLESAHDRLCRIFDLDPRQNIWQGKCAVVLCRNRENYVKWMGAIAPDDPQAGESVGLCSANTAFAGSIVIHFFNNPGRDANTEITLCHELTHGFIAQFHGNRPLPSWAHEGLAEFVSTNGKGHESKNQASHERVRAVNSLEDFFAARNIQFRHYGTAFEITSLLLKKNARGYARFVKAVTEGREQGAALKTHCNLTFDQVAAGYAKMLGMRGLKPH